jgi:hypothetical protein
MITGTIMAIRMDTMMGMATDTVILMQAIRMVGILMAGMGIATRLPISIQRSSSGFR